MYIHKKNNIGMYAIDAMFLYINLLSSMYVVLLGRSDIKKITNSLGCKVNVFFPRSMSNCVVRLVLASMS